MENKLQRKYKCKNKKHKNARPVKITTMEVTFSFAFLKHCNTCLVHIYQITRIDNNIFILRKCLQTQIRRVVFYDKDFHLNTVFLLAIQNFISY